MIHELCIEHLLAEHNFSQKLQSKRKSLGLYIRMLFNLRNLLSGIR